MPWTYKNNPELQIVEVDFSGRTTASDLQELTSELIALQKAEGPKKFLVDTGAMVCFANANHVSPSQTVVDVPGQCCECAELGEVFLVVEDGLVEMGNGPALRDGILK